MKKIIPSLSKMWLKVRNIDQTLFPGLKEVLGPLSPKEEKLIRILDFAEIENFVTPIVITNPPKDRPEMARAFVAKAVYNFSTTRELIERLHIDATLRKLCGWRRACEIPSESKFSRVFDEFSRMKIAVKAQESFVERYLSEVLFLYASTDSTAIPLREKPVKKKPTKRPKKKSPTILEQQKTMQDPEEMLALLPTACDVGVKQNAQGYRTTWNGGKLHLSVVDGDIPITAVYTSASVHDSSVAVPMIQKSSAAVNYLYDLCDAAYDSAIIRNASVSLNHRPLIDLNPRNSSKRKEEIAAAKQEKEKLQALNLYNDSDEQRYNHRSSVERVNGNLKDNYGCRNFYYQGALKVASVLSFAVLALCIDQSLKLVT